MLIIKTLFRGLPIGLLLLIASSLPLFAADPIEFSALRVSHHFASGKEETILDGKVRIQSGVFEIHSEQIHIYGAAQRYVESAGPVTIHDSKRNLDLSGDSLFYDRDTDILRIEGNAVMEDFKNEMVVKGGIMENRNKDNIAIVQVGARVFKKDISARSEMLVYHRDSDIVELSGLPLVYKKQDQYQADTITINLKTEEINLLGRVQGTVQTNSAASPSPSASPAASPSASTVPGAPPSPSPSSGVTNGQ